MENTEVANTSTKPDKKKKSKKQSSESLVNVEPDVKPRRSFWRSLFRRPSKKPDLSKSGVSTHLNAIYEESKTSQEKDPSEEIAEFKTTLKKIAPEVLVEPKIETTELLSVSSSLSQASVTFKQNEPEPVKEYSFEYSEASDSSDVEENKVKFVEKVEQKDADSNIVVKDLNPGEDKPTENSEEAAAENSSEKVPQYKRSKDEKTEDESEIWNERLNEIAGFSKSVLPISVDASDNASSGYCECRLDDFFKMVLYNEEQIVKYSMTYDPISNYNYLPKSDNELITDDKQKVARKRKMMSLLNDKTKMAEYLKEIEQQQHEKTMDYVVNLSVPQNSPKPQLPLENEQILFLLENTRDKLQTLENNRNIDPKIFSLYPDNYLNIFNILSEVNLEENTDNSIQVKSGTDEEKCPETEKEKEKEIESIFKELFTSITELKETCILNGCTIENNPTEPLITMKPLIETTVVKPILDEILENVFQKDLTKPTNLSISNPIYAYSEFDSNPELPPEVEINNKDNLQSSQSINSEYIPRNCTELQSTSDSVKKSKKFGLFHEEIPDNTLTTFSSYNPPDITDSLKRIFFGGEENESDFNLIEDIPSKPGTSKLDSVPQLPSVPSTPLSGSQTSSTGGITTLMNQTENSSTSVYVDKILDVVNTTNVQSSESHKKKDYSLERKHPELNLFKTEKDEPLDSQSITQSIEESLRVFQENMIKINSTNQKTINMLKKSGSLSTEGSLSILSTITENVEMIESITNSTHEVNHETNP